MMQISTEWSEEDLLVGARGLSSFALPDIITHARGAFGKPSNTSIWSKTSESHFPSQTGQPLIKITKYSYHCTTLGRVGIPSWEDHGWAFFPGRMGLLPDQSFPVIMHHGTLDRLTEE